MQLINLLLITAFPVGSPTQGPGVFGLPGTYSINATLGDATPPTPIGHPLTITYTTQSSAAVLSAKAEAFGMASTDEPSDVGGGGFASGAWNLAVTAALTTPISTTRKLKVTLIFGRKVRTFAKGLITWSEPGYTDATGYEGWGVAMLNPKGGLQFSTPPDVYTFPAGNRKREAHVIGTSSENFLDWVETNSIQIQMQV